MATYEQLLEIISKQQKQINQLLANQQQNPPAPAPPSNQVEMPAASQNPWAKICRKCNSED